MIHGQKQAWIPLFFFTKNQAIQKQENLMQLPIAT